MHLLYEHRRIFINNFLGSPFVKLIIPIFELIINFNHKNKGYFKLKATYAANTKNISISNIFYCPGRMMADHI